MIEQPIFLVGRSRECDLITDPQLAEVHFYLYRAKGKLTLGVVADSPVVTLDGRPVTRAALADGAEVRAGSLTIRAELPALDRSAWPLGEKSQPQVARTLRCRTETTSHAKIADHTPMGQLLKDVGRWLAHHDASL